jgi:hypothetical protein
VLRFAVLRIMYRNPITVTGMFFSGLSLFLVSSNLAGMSFSVIFDQLYQYYSSLSAIAFLTFFGWLQLEVPQQLKDLWMVYTLLGLSMSRSILFFANKRKLNELWDSVIKLNRRIVSSKIHTNMASGLIVSLILAILAVVIWPVIYFAIRGNQLQIFSIDGEREEVGFRFVFTGYLVGVILICAGFVIINAFS